MQGWMLSSLASLAPSYPLCCVLGSGVPFSGVTGLPRSHSCVSHQLNLVLFVTVLSMVCLLVWKRYNELFPPLLANINAAAAPDRHPCRMLPVCCAHIAPFSQTSHRPVWLFVFILNGQPDAVTLSKTAEGLRWFTKQLSEWLQNSGLPHESMTKLWETGDFH